MIKLITILGARPQFIKAVAVSSIIRQNFGNRISEYILHTGQHFDENMSDVFFQELGLPKPHYRLVAASPDKSIRPGEMIDGISEILRSENPDVVLVYGDTNSTLAGAIAASNLKIPLVHIEAGLRSYNKNMPEELNRMVCDHLSTLLFSPTPQGIRNLAIEGIRHHEPSNLSLSNPGVYLCGDVMLDVALHFKAKVADMQWSEIGLKDPGKPWILCTIHREQNASNPENLTSLLRAIKQLPDTHQCAVIWPVHPRTRKALDDLPGKELVSDILNHPQITLCDPLSYLKTQFLLHHCHIVLTDSGGLQKEAFFAGKPSVIMRSETEWTELLDNGYAMLCDTDINKMNAAIKAQWSRDMKNLPSFYGNGHAAASIVEHILNYFEA